MICKLFKVGYKGESALVLTVKTTPTSARERDLMKTVPNIEFVSIFIGHQPSFVKHYHMKIFAQMKELFDELDPGASIMFERFEDVQTN